MGRIQVNLVQGDARQLQTARLDGCRPARGSRFTRVECHPRGMDRLPFAVEARRGIAAQHAARRPSRVGEVRPPQWAASFFLTERALSPIGHLADVS
jgi:hypothetical protein